MLCCHTHTAPGRTLRSKNCRLLEVRKAPISCSTPSSPSWLFCGRRTVSTANLLRASQARCSKPILQATVVASLSCAGAQRRSCKRTLVRCPYAACADPTLIRYQQRRCSIGGRDTYAKGESRCNALIVGGELGGILSYTILQRRHIVRMSVSARNKQRTVTRPKRRCSNVSMKEYVYV